MKLINWKTLGITCLVCLLPILLGVALWEKLPDTMAIHFDINNQPDNFASKGFVVFGLPCLMAVVQIFVSVVTDLNEHKLGTGTKFAWVLKWMIPVMAVVLQVVTLGFGLGWNLDIRRIVIFLVGGMFLALGKYMSKLDWVKNPKVPPEKARKINRFIGAETAVLGLLFWGSILFPPIATVVCLILLIPYTILGVVYSIKVEKE